MRLVVEVRGHAGAPHGWVASPSGERLAFSGWLELVAAVETHLMATPAGDEERADPPAATEPPSSVAQPDQLPEVATRSEAGLLGTGTCPDSSGHVHLALGTPEARQPTRTFPNLVVRGPTGPDTD